MDEVGDLDVPSLPRPAPMPTMQALQRAIDEYERLTGRTCHALIVSEVVMTNYLRELIGQGWSLEDGATLLRHINGRDTAPVEFNGRRLYTNRVMPYAEIHVGE